MTRRKNPTRTRNLTYVGGRGVTKRCRPSWLTNSTVVCEFKWIHGWRRRENQREIYLVFVLPILGSGRFLICRDTTTVEYVVYRVQYPLINRFTANMFCTEYALINRFTAITTPFHPPPPSSIVSWISQLHSDNFGNFLRWLASHLPLPFGMVGDIWEACLWTGLE